MSQPMPQVRSYMTKVPYVIEDHTPLEDASRLMREHGVRHLPVRRRGRLVGVLTERNATAMLMHDGARYHVADAMIPDPFVTAPHEELATVVAEMAEEKHGCAIVQGEDGDVEGIFTTVDACRALRELLQTFYPR